MLAKELIVTNKIKLIPIKNKKPKYPRCPGCYATVCTKELRDKAKDKAKDKEKTKDKEQSAPLESMLDWTPLKDMKALNYTKELAEKVRKKAKEQSAPLESMLDWTPLKDMISKSKEG